MGTGEGIERLVFEAEAGHESDLRYAGFFECFNRGGYFEAHEVLEELWLEDRYGPNGAFYKGLIQIAGAFVHVTKSRTGPAIALLKLAQKNLARYPERHERLHVSYVRGWLQHWLRVLNEGAVCPKLDVYNLPRLSLDV